MPKLADIASIQTGLHLLPEPMGKVLYLQVKNFSDYAELKPPLIADVVLNHNSAKHLLKPGDVLFAAKGPKNFAHCFSLQDTEAVASTSFFVIKTLSGLYSPAFIAAFLNYGPVIKRLKYGAQGSNLPSISKMLLEGLTLPELSLQKQEYFVRITQLMNREQNISQQINELNARLRTLQVSSAFDITFNTSSPEL